MAKSINNFIGKPKITNTNQGNQGGDEEDDEYGG